MVRKRGPPLNGGFYAELADRELGNKVILVPKSIVDEGGVDVTYGAVRWMRSRKHCDNENISPYYEDVRPFGFIAEKTIVDGFSFAVTRASEDAASITYDLSIVDPSAGSLGQGIVTWTIEGHPSSYNGPNVQIVLSKNEPVRLTLTRDRNSVVDSFVFRESANNLDRSAGGQFVLNLVP